MPYTGADGVPAQWGVPLAPSCNERKDRMSALPRRFGDAMSSLMGSEASVGRRPVPARVERAVNHGVAVEHGRGIVQAARARAVEYVAEEALQATGRLSCTEAFYARQVPHAAARLQAIADIAAMNLAEIVAETGRD